MRIRNRGQLIIFLLLIGRGIAAQDYVDLAKLYYSTSAVNNFENSLLGSRLEEIGADLTVPVPVGENLTALSGLIYEGIRTQMFEAQNRGSISSLTLKAGINRRHSSRWSGTYLLLPKVSSDFRKVTKRDFQVGGIAILKYDKTDNLKYKVGLYANSELFGAWAVPIAGLYYISSSKRFEANLTLPLMADMNYRLYPAVDVGMNFSGQVRTYHLDDIGTPSGSGYLARASNELYGYLKFNIGKGAVVQAKVGHSLGRSYRVYDEGARVSFGLPLVYINDKREQVNTDFKDGLVYQLALIYRLSTVK